MLYIRIVNNEQHEQFTHSEGVLQLGRKPKGEGTVRIVRDEFVSRDQFLLEELAENRVRLTNVSKRRNGTLLDGRVVAVGGKYDLELPVTMKVGQTTIEIEGDNYGEPIDTKTLAMPPRRERAPGPRPEVTGLLTQLGEQPQAEMFAGWLETLVQLQRHDADEKDTYRSAARALVDLIGLDLGMVILRNSREWTTVATHVANDRVSPRFSKTIADKVAEQRQTLFQDVASLKLQAESLAALDAVVASPIFDMHDNVAGVLYGMRARPVVGRTSIRPLEAHVVQLLAATVGASLTRSTALRTRVQFEQFFSTELVAALERNPALLEGRNQEVTILVSDLRDSVRLAERLTPATSCQLIRDLMEQLTTCICDQGGVVVDYAGDGILAMWNAPLPQDDHTGRACRAALLMQAEMPALNLRWAERVGFPLRLGIGINTGEAQVGNTGSARKLKYGPHGQTVNLAARVQAATKLVGAGTLLTSSTWERVTSLFQVRPCPPQQLQGLGEVILHELLGDRGTQVLH